MVVPVIATEDGFHVLDAYVDSAEEKADLIATIKRYADGDCALLARSISSRTGWNIWALWTPDNAMPVHYAVKTPGGAFIDSYGRCPKGMEAIIINRRYSDRPSACRWKLLGDANSFPSGDRSASQQTHRFLETKWMVAVVGDGS